MHESEKWKWSRVRLLATNGLQPTKLLRPWDFPGKSTGVGCHCLLQQVTIYRYFLSLEFLLWNSFALLEYCEKALRVRNTGEGIANQPNPATEIVCLASTGVLWVLFVWMLVFHWIWASLKQGTQLQSPSTVCSTPPVLAQSLSTPHWYLLGVEFVIDS